MKYFWRIVVGAWISTAVAVCVGIYFTRSPWCMWAPLLPCFCSYNNKNGEEKV